MVGVRVFLDRTLNARAKHLGEVISGSPPGRYVVDVWFQTELRIERERNFRFVHKVVHGAVGNCFLWRFDPTLKSNLADACGNAARYITFLHSGITGDALLADPCRVV